MALPMQLGENRNNIIKWECVVEESISIQEKGIDPFLWAVRLSTSLCSTGATVPSPELAHSLVSYIFGGGKNNAPIAWKFLDKALAVNLVPPFLVLALLSTRIIPNRKSAPAGYRLYLELLKNYAFSFKFLFNGTNYQQVIISINQALDLERTFGVPPKEPGVFVVEFIFGLVWQLLDASLDDEGLLELRAENKSIWASGPRDMNVDNYENITEKRFEHCEKLRHQNTVVAMEIIGQFFQDEITSRLLHLARQNLPKQWEGFAHGLQVLRAKSVVLRNSNIICPEALSHLISETRRTPSLASFSGLCHGASHSSLWLPLDIVYEDAMDSAQVNTTSAIETITGALKTLKASNGSSWHDAFLALWLAALRLVQRERDPIEGPVPRLDTRMCMLLSVTTLVVSDLVVEEENPVEILEPEFTGIEKPNMSPKDRRFALVSCLQSLGDYKSLLAPPRAVSSAASLAAAKAMMSLSGIDVGSDYFECIKLKDLPADFSGNLLHLIVEACIARNLLDVSAYRWPGYVNGQINRSPDFMPSQVPGCGWSLFMKGAPLTPSMVTAMVGTPASSLAELEKVFELALHGSDEERVSAATVLCGASLLQGWNVQEHTLYFITRLLSPPVPAEYSGGESHLIAYAPMLNVLLDGTASIDCIQIFSVHGLVPPLAASLMPICEVFGSLVPDKTWKLPKGEFSAHAVFSNAFAALLKLWRFNHPPLEYGVGDVPPVGSQLTPEYLLLVRNSLLPSSSSVNNPKESNRRRLSAIAVSSSPDPIFVDSFPKLRVWYLQHRACIASTLSGLVSGTPVHQIVDALLRMIFRKIVGGSESSNTSPIGPSGTGSSSSSGPGSQDSLIRPKLPAWDIMEAVPFVVDAALTACAHGQLSPRELATGLKELADFLPAAIATIVSYFSAEVTRGIWKPVPMNGTDWPSPIANLANVEEQIKKILATTGVDIPSLPTGGSCAATLPLPLAAFVSLTITYKIDKASERFLHLVGPAMESLAAGCPWPCLPIVASLWTQKAKRWSDFLTFSASRTVFLHNNDAVVQLLKTCFTATMGLTPNIVLNGGGVGPLLGHGFGSHFCGGISPVAPGILYLRVYRSLRDIMFLADEIVSLLMQSVREIVGSSGCREREDRVGKIRCRLRSTQASLASAMTRIKIAASLGATLVWLSGGSGLVQCVIKETLPSWFVSVHKSEWEGGPLGGTISVFAGFALAYFAMLCVAFAWGLEPSSVSSSKRRLKVLGVHMEFLASSLDGKISLGCDQAIWNAYVSGLLSLMVCCTPNWVLEIDVEVLKRVSRGLKARNEEELALAVLAAGGINSMGAAAELIIENSIK